MNNPKSIFYFADVEWNLPLGELKSAAGEIQRLSPIHRKLLQCLLERADQVVTRAELFDAVWPNQVVSDDVLTRAISDLRTHLAKLDDKTKFIETLPKRGYRWVVPLRDEKVSESTTGELIKLDQLPKKVNFIGVFACYLLAAFALAMLITWVLSKPRQPQIPIAILPVVSNLSQSPLSAMQVQDQLLRLLRKNPRLLVLSKAAVDGKPANPFPYFAHEFGAYWVLDTRLSQTENGMQVELSLVDAKTGFEQRSQKIEMVALDGFEKHLAKMVDEGWFDLRSF